MPFAAFFVAFLLLLCIPDGSRKLAVCLLLGALAGLCAVYTTNARLERARANYAGRTVLLTAEVERADSSYFSDTVDATLWVESVNGRRAGFRIACAELPACAAGQRVQGWFTLQQPDIEERTAQYADGIALQAEPLAEKPQLTVLGESGSFRARTHRLQQKLSESLRREMHRDTGGVLAAMTVGDRTHLSPALRSAYRGAGLAHVLVVSGMHVSILCGEVFRLDARRKKERCYAALRLRAVWKALLALLLVGVTGCTPSVLRAAGAVWLSGLGVWVYGPSDALTSLGVAGVLMTAGNSYAVCDIGFELSFAAVVGTLAGSAVVRRSREVWAARRAEKKRPRSGIRKQRALGILSGVWETACISACASMATFPVLVLRGMSASLYALVSGVAVLWLVEPILLTGLAAALLGIRSNGRAFRYALLAGLLSSLLWNYALGKPWGVDGAIVGMACNFLVFVLCTKSFARYQSQRLTVWQERRQPRSRG